MQGVKRPRCADLALVKKWLKREVTNGEKNNMATTEQNRKQGKKNRVSGADFERRVRADLEGKGWIVSKWQNNVDLTNNKCTACKNKFLGPGKPMMLGAGFPDFITYKNYTKEANCGGPCFDVVFVECKINGKLDPTERDKAKWYLEKGCCSEFLIASKTKEGNRVKINYLGIPNG